MGFNTWNLYHCSVTGQLLKETTSAMKEKGLKDDGFIYVNTDDCWMNKNRTAAGNQAPQPAKFPDGFKAVADFIHGIGMKSGLYTKGPHTCAGSAYVRRVCSLLQPRGAGRKTVGFVVN